MRRSPDWVPGAVAAILMAAAAGPAAAAATQAPARGAVAPVRFAVAPPLGSVDLAPYRRSAPPALGRVPGGGERELNPNDAEVPAALRDAEPPRGGVDPVVQRWEGEARAAMPTPSVAFPGIGNLDGVLPPDPAGDVGPSYYVQWVNLHLDIFDKARGTSAIGGPIAGNALFAALGGDCASHNDGDPVVLYDQLAGRWVLSQMTTTSHQCVAVSQTSDPVYGGWYLYDFLLDAGRGYALDAPKLGVWPRGYALGANMFSGSSFVGTLVAMLERPAMLAGDPGARVVWFFYPYPAYPWAWSVVPADVDGPAPPSARRATFLTLMDDGWLFAAPYDRDELLLFSFDVDWANPSAASFSGPEILDLTAAGYPFDTNLCGYARNCIPQPGTGAGLDALAGRLMYRPKYRYFGTHESLVATHAVDADGTDHAGMRWYELRAAGGSWAVEQAGTFAPDADHRWAGDAALDADGDIAVGYSVSSTVTYPGIRWAGRLASDPPGTLAQGEVTVVAGSGSQTSTYYRWGDYSAMTVDPADGCTFWYTNEYVRTTGTATWETFIASFRFPSCSPCTLPAPTGVTATATPDNLVELAWSAVAGAAEYRVYRSTTSGGPYTLLGTSTTTGFTDHTVDGGVTYYYVVTARASCESAFSAEVSATPTGSCTLPPVFGGLVSASASYSAKCAVDLAWDAATARCGGPVTYAIYRSTASGFTPSAANRIAWGVTGTSYTDASGLLDGVTYHYVVRAVDASNGAEDANGEERSATAHGPRSAATLYGPEGFETYPDGDMAGWGTVVFGGSAADWRGVQRCAAHGGSRIFRYGGTSCTRNYASNRHAAAYPPPVTVPAGSANVRLAFWHRWRFESGYDGAYLRVSLDGATWTYVDGAAILSGGYNDAISGVPVWSGRNDTFTRTVVDLDAACAAAGAAGGCAGRTVYVGFVAYADYWITDDGWYLDDVQITADVPGSCTGTPDDVTSLAARATSGQVKLEWVNPPAGYASTRICRDTTAYPTDPTTCTVVADVAGTPGAYDTYTDAGLTDGTTYYYTVFVDDGAGDYSTGRRVWARPFDTSGKVKWSYHAGESALQPPGVYPGGVGTGAGFVVANDRMLHGLNPTGSGGDWPRSGAFSWEPMGMNGVAQSRPPVVPITVGSSDLVVFLASDDGHVYAADARTGSTLWRSPQLATMLVGSPAGIFGVFGGSVDLLFVGTRDVTVENVLYALDPSTGAVVWSFDNGGGAGAIGIVSSTPAVDYTANRVYFTSRARSGGSSDTVWCLSVSSTGASKVWSVAVGDADASPVVFGGRVYVGTNDGTVYALDAATGAVLASYATGDGAVKGFVVPEFTSTLPRHLYFATTTPLWSVLDSGSSMTLEWSTTAVPDPSAPMVVPGTSEIYVGSSDGSLYQLDTATGAVVASVVLGDGTAAVGSPARDYLSSLAYVGTESGAIYGVALPLR